MKPLRVGLTGGVASGKSTVAHELAALGVPVIDLDQVARDVVAPGTPLLANVVRRFGADLLQPAADGNDKSAPQLDRRKLRERVFADPAERRALEDMLHPAIYARTQELAAAIRDVPYLVIVNPLLVEQHAQSRYDRVVVVDCDEAQQRARLIARDGSSATEADAILAAQASRADRLAAADDVIHNTADVTSLREQVKVLHGELLGLAGAIGL